MYLFDEEKLIYYFLEINEDMFLKPTRINKEMYSNNFYNSNKERKIMLRQTSYGLAYNKTRVFTKIFPKQEEVKVMFNDYNKYYYIYFKDYVASITLERIEYTFNLDRIRVVGERNYFPFEQLK